MVVVEGKMKKIVMRRGNQHGNQWGRCKDHVRIVKSSLSSSKTPHILAGEVKRCPVMIVRRDSDIDGEVIRLVESEQFNYGKCPSPLNDMPCSSRGDCFTCIGEEDAYYASNQIGMASSTVLPAIVLSAPPPQYRPLAND